MSKSGVIILPGRLSLISWGQNQVARVFNLYSGPQSHSKLPKYNMGRVMVPGQYEVDSHSDAPLHRQAAATSNQSALPPVLHTPTAIFVRLACPGTPFSLWTESSMVECTCEYQHSLAGGRIHCRLHHIPHRPVDVPLRVPPAGRPSS